MPKYLVNKDAVAKAEELIKARQNVVRSEWSEVQPDAKACYAFVFGDLRRLHRSGLMACRFRTTQWDHKDIELASHDLIQKLDARRGKT